MILRIRPSWILGPWRIKHIQIRFLNWFSRVTGIPVMIGVQEIVRTGQLYSINAVARYFNRETETRRELTAHRDDSIRRQVLSTPARIVSAPNIPRTSRSDGESTFVNRGGEIFRGVLPPYQREAVQRIVQGERTVDVENTGWPMGRIVEVRGHSAEEQFRIAYREGMARDNYMSFSTTIPKNKSVEKFEPTYNNRLEDVE